MKYIFLLTLFLLIHIDVTAQEDKSQNPDENLPYRVIPEYPEVYTPETVAARMIDGLGFRYYWATEGLNEKDLEYKPSAEARTTDETIDHILGLSLTIVNASMNQPNTFPRQEESLTFEQKRARTLEHLAHASQVLKDQPANTLDHNKVIFTNENGSSEFPYWNMINGPIADAIYHIGQVVSFRRASGNPINPNIRVFLGTVRE